MNSIAKDATPTPAPTSTRRKGPVRWPACRAGASTTASGCCCCGSLVLVGAHRRLADGGRGLPEQVQRRQLRVGPGADLPQRPISRARPVTPPRWCSTPPPRSATRPTRPASPGGDQAQGAPPRQRRGQPDRHRPASSRSARTATSPTPPSSSTSWPRTCPTSDIQKIVDTAEAARADGFDVQLGGQPISATEQPAFGASEGIGILAAIIILLVAFGSFIAMGLPIVTALFGIGAGVGVVGADQPGADRAHLRHRAGRHDRHRRGHRLRPVHRHPLPPGPGRGS